MVDGRVTEVRDEQPTKTQLPIALMVDGSSTEIKDEQFAKTQVPREVTVHGIFICLREAQS